MVCHLVNWNMQGGPPPRPKGPDMDRDEYNTKAMDRALQLMGALALDEEWDQDLEDAIDMVAEAVEGHDSPEGVDLRIDAVVSIHNAHFKGTEHVLAPRPERNDMNYETENPTRDDTPELVDVTTRDGYNAVVVDEAIACQIDVVDVDGSDPDEELGAQIAICQDRTGPAQDRAVDHLREMLLTSYLDLEDLPRPVLAREEAATKALHALLTEPQLAALRQTALAIVKTSPDGDEVGGFEAILRALDAVDGE